MYCPILYYWRRFGSLIEVEDKKLNTHTILHTTTSDPKDWELRGDEFCDCKLWSLAKQCYSKAYSKHKVKHTEAMQCYEDTMRSKSEGEKEQKYLNAALAFLESDEHCHDIKELKNAAKCLSKTKLKCDNLAADLHMRLRQVSGSLCF